MTYLSDKTKKEKKHARTVLLIVALFLMSFLWPTTRIQIYRLIESPLLTMHTWYTHSISSSSALRTYMTTRANDSARITSLENHIEDLENNLVFRNLSEALYATSTVDSSRGRIVVFPIVEDITTLYGSIIVSKGFTDDIKVGSPVYIRGRQVVCIIQEVYAKTSRCVLLSHHGASVAGVIVHGDETEMVTLTGDGGGNYQVTVPKESLAKVGDQVVYEKDQTLLLGTIAAIESDQQDVFVHIYVRGAYNPVTTSRLYVDKE